MTPLEEARAFFAKDKYATEATGIVIDVVGDAYAKCSLDQEPRHYNAVGQVMGGVSFTLADFVFAIAANFRKERPTVSAVSQISHVGTVKGTRLIGESRLIKDGRRNCFYEITVSDDLGNLVAVCSITGAHL